MQLPISPFKRSYLAVVWAKILLLRVGLFLLSPHTPDQVIKIIHFCPWRGGVRWIFSLVLYNTYIALIPPCPTFLGQPQCDYLRVMVQYRAEYRYRWEDRHHARQMHDQNRLRSPVSRKPGWLQISPSRLDSTVIVEYSSPWFDNTSSPPNTGFLSDGHSKMSSTSNIR